MIADFFIRAFTESDYFDIEQLWIETNLTNTKRGDTLQTIQNTLNCGGTFFVIEHLPTKTAIGSSWITNDGRRLYLHHFGIKPEFQGKKLAKELLETSLNFAKNKNLQIKLEVDKNSKKAINLYQNYGFKYLGDYIVFIIRNYDIEK